MVQVGDSTADKTLGITGSQRQKALGQRRGLGWPTEEPEGQGQPSVTADTAEVRRVTGLRARALGF